VQLSIHYRLVLSLRHAAVGLLTALCLLCIGCQDQPLALMEKARYALKSAAGAGATKYAAEQYQKAEEFMRRGRLEVARQNGRFAPFRDYQAADSLLTLAIDAAAKAATSAQTRLTEWRTLTETEVKNIESQLEDWRDALDGSLVVYAAERHWDAAKLSLTMSRQLVYRGEYDEAMKTLSTARKSLSELSRILEDYANDAAQKLDVWRRWVRETVESSRVNGSRAIIVDKQAHKLYLIRGGQVEHTYRCELGYNSARQKYLSGDGATPEGTYHVTKVRHTGSKYYKALMINYPNERDKQRFRENKAKGYIASHAHIGGLIEIHGNGGRDEDWTNGCVALTDRDMDHLMQRVSVGTPVTIVRQSDRWP
jgi:hypothetical protein